MRFKRLVSGIAALTVAMGTFATMTITASAAEGDVTWKLTKKYALRIKLADGSSLDLANGYKVNQLDNFKDNTSDWEELQESGKTVPSKFLDTSISGTNYIIDSVNSANPLTDTEMTEKGSTKHQGNIVVTGQSGNILEDGLILEGDSYYWFDVTVHQAQTYSLKVNKSVGSNLSAPFSEGLSADKNLADFSNGTWSYNEADTQTGNGIIYVPRFVKNGDNAYELSQGPMGIDLDGHGISYTEGTFEVKVDKAKFAGKKSDYDFSLPYVIYSKPSEVPSGATLTQIVEAEGDTSDPTASMGKKGGSSVTIDNLVGGQKYYFVVTHSNDSTIKGQPQISMAFIDDSRWKTDVVSAIAKDIDGEKKGSIKIELNESGGYIDTVLVFSTEVEKFNLNIKATGVDPAPQFDLQQNEFIKGDPSIESVTYSYPRYVKDTNGNLYKATGEYENGSYTSYSDNSVKYTKKIEGQTLTDFSGAGNYNVTHSYSEYHYPGVTGDFKELYEPSGSQEEDTASNGTCVKLTSGQLATSVTKKLNQPGQYTLVVRYKGTVNVVDDAGRSIGSPLNGSGDVWQETTVKVMVKKSDLDSQSEYTIKFTGDNSYIDTILVYSEQVASSISFRLLDKAEFKEYEKDDPYTAYEYQADIVEGTDGKSYTIAVKFDDGVSPADSKDSNATLSDLTKFPTGTTITGSTTIRFGIIAPSKYTTVTPYAPEVD